jgi:Predicted transcriptional regulator with C-terminal CBS domains
MANNLDPRLTPAQRFGRELARMRKSAGLSQVALSKHLGCSASLIAHIEIAARNPTADFAKRCDAFFGTEDRFARLQRDIASPATGPSWYMRWSTEVEPRARVLRSWDPLVVPGLLQTEDYARAMFVGGLAKTTDEVEKLVTARLRRQAVVEREDPPVIWALIEEGVLHRKIGGPQVMCGQLDHLIALARRPNVTIQVVPEETECTVGYTSGFILAELPDSPTVVSVESLERGVVSSEHDFVCHVWDRYDKLRAEAYRAPESLNRIKEAKAQWMARM